MTEQFPTVPYILNKTPITQLVQSRGAAQYRQARQIAHRPFYEYEISMDVLKPSDRDKVRDLWITHQGWSGSGSALDFHFEDPDDHTMTDVQFGTGDGSTKEFQLKSEWTSGSESEKFGQGHIQPDSETIKNGGSTTTAYSLDDESGIITFDSAPANGNKLKASYDFFRLVRFGDVQPIEINTASIKSWNVILIEVAG